MVKCDTRVIGDGKPGPVTNRLLERFRHLTRSTGTPIFGEETRPDAANGSVAAGRGSRRGILRGGRRDRRRVGRDEGVALLTSIPLFPALEIQKMQCDVCQSKTAEVFLTHIDKGKVQKVNLCKDCSKERGVEDPTGFALTELLEGLGTSVEIEKPIPAAGTRPGRQQGQPTGRDHDFLDGGEVPGVRVFAGGFQEDRAAGLQRVLRHVCREPGQFAQGHAQGHPPHRQAARAQWRVCRRWPSGCRISRAICKKPSRPRTTKTPPTCATRSASFPVRSRIEPAFCRCGFRLSIHHARSFPSLSS